MASCQQPSKQPQLGFNRLHCTLSRMVGLVTAPVLPDICLPSAFYQPCNVQVKQQLACEAATGMLSRIIGLVTVPVLPGVCHSSIPLQFCEHMQLGCSM